MRAGLVGMLIAASLSGCAAGPWARHESAPAAAPAVASVTRDRLVEATYSGAEGVRRYRLFIPASRGADAPPLVVFLHGCTQTAEDVARGTRLDAEAGASGVAVLYPEQPATAHPNRCWSWYDPAHQQRDTGEPALIAAMTRHVMAQVGTDDTRTSIAGISAGGAMALIVAAAYPELFAAAGSHSGVAVAAATDVGAALRAMREGASAPAAALPDLLRGHRTPIPLILFHGDADEVVHPRNADAILAQWRSAFPVGGPLSDERGQAGDAEGAGMLEYRRLVHGDAGGAPVLEVWRIAGLGHAWSGGSTEGSYADPRGPDATRELLRFLVSHRLSVPDAPREGM